MKNILKWLIIAVALPCSMTTRGDHGAEISDATLTALGRDREQFEDSGPQFNTGSIVNVYLNYQSFVDANLIANNPSITINELDTSVRLATQRWGKIPSIDLRLRYRGINNVKTSPNNNEIVIVGVPTTHFNTAGAQAINNVFGKCKIEFFGQNGSGNLLYTDVFHFDNYPAGSDFLHNLLMHEMGHCMGLGHNNYFLNNALAKGDYRTTMTANGTYPHNTFGPYIEDIEDLQDMYPLAPARSHVLRRSSDHGDNWTNIASNIDDFNTTHSSVIVSRDSNRMIMFYQSPQGNPALLHGNSDGTIWDSSKWWRISGQKSIYGVSGGGYSNEYMMAWVDPTDENRMKVAFSDDGGESWRFRDDTNFRSGSRPGIVKVAGNTWILSYTHLDSNRWANENGQILWRVSTNDGEDWSAPVELTQERGLRTDSPINLARSQNATTDIRIGFSTMSGSTTSWTGSASSLGARVDSGSVVFVDFDGTVMASMGSEVPVARNLNKFVVGMTQTAGAGFRTCRLNEGATPRWTCTVSDMEFNDTTPALSASPAGSWLFTFDQIW